jgi:hypothetical protein
MASDGDDLTLQARIRLALENSDKPISYGALARDLNVEGPGSIARVTSALEAMMREDAAAGKPFWAAMCEGKLTGGLPALGFFQMARALGRYDGPETGPEAAAFVMRERALLRG